MDAGQKVTNQPLMDEQDLLCLQAAFAYVAMAFFVRVQRSKKEVCYEINYNYSKDPNSGLLAKMRFFVLLLIFFVN